MEWAGGTTGREAHTRTPLDQTTPQLQAAKEELEARSADTQGRERRAREELHECQAQLKWAEFELTKVRSEVSNAMQRNPTHVAKKEKG